MVIITPKTFLKIIDIFGHKLQCIIKLVVLIHLRVFFIYSIFLINGVK